MKKYIDLRQYGYVLYLDPKIVLDEKFIEEAKQIEISGVYYDIDRKKLRMSPGPRLYYVGIIKYTDKPLCEDIRQILESEGVLYITTNDMLRFYYINPDMLRQHMRTALLKTLPDTGEYTAQMNMKYKIVMIVAEYKNGKVTFYDMLP